MNHGPTFSFSTLILALTFMGCLNGAFAGLLFRRKRWYLWAAAGAVLAYGAQEAYSWYRWAYIGAGSFEHGLGYGACAYIVANCTALLPLFALLLVSCVRPCRRPAQWLGAAVLCMALGAGAYGVTRGNAPEEIHTVRVTVPGLPASFEGYRIAQITDTHIGPYYHCDDLDAALGAAGVAGASLAVVTGDLIDDTRYMDQTARILHSRQRDFRDGMLYVWGNHEYYRGRSTVRAALEAAGIPILENGHTAVRRGGDALYVAGVDYPWAKGPAHAAEMKEMADEAFAGIPAGSRTIFLAHHSDFIDEGFAHGAALTLTGHTHAMQFGIGGQPVFTPFKYTRGMYSDGTHLGYVSRGDGGWFPFRLGCRRELVLFELHGQ